MNENIALKVNNLSKKFRLYHEKPTFIKSWKKNRYEELLVLKNVNLEIKFGETISIIGRNGSGKSTLLKILCGVMEPTTGTIDITGCIVPLLELGAGFHQELTGRENVYLNASLMSLSKKEIDQKFDAIVAFSELENFIDSPLYTYSSGMYARLGFSIAIHTNFDILIIDEILEVGDVGFQKKSFDKIMKFKNNNKTIIFVTHSIESAKSISDHIYWLDNGTLVSAENNEIILNNYLHSFNE